MAPADAQPWHPNVRSVWSIIILAIAILSGLYFNDQIPLIHGFGRSYQAKKHPLRWRCSQITHPFMEGCEHIWLDHAGRNLYGACTNASSSEDWNPSGRPDGAWAKSRRDHLAVLAIDPSGQANEYQVQKLEIRDKSHKDINLHGFDARYVNGRLRFWVANHLPAMDTATGKVLDVQTHSSIEIFDLDPTSNELMHVKSIASNALDSPNSVAVDLTGEEFLVINGCRTKLGPFRGGPFQFGSESIAYCRTDIGSCETIALEGVERANSVVTGRDGLFYVSMSSMGTLAVYEISNGKPNRADILSLDHALDHLSVDARGNIIVTAFSDVIELQKASMNPQASVAAGTVLMLQKKGGRSGSFQGQEYLLHTVLEDRAGKLISTTQTAVHDAQSDRLFLAGVFSPGVSICEKR
ncbi:hypothetical protein N7462_004582 [Penicillium macrosclerotiorum]|uniref:uncharacterized protein n=1 Tax=Penicillium macrosclerotiorum TaxID=303699 RepID=UPI0025472EDF|nr:uncharacterized protein N7462_004582 [Penicillium macrosclerotiorum]KAJ5690190.1 hypothetical protein N7462_004582 [Penicillium macrosclerotiorum]